MSAKKTVSITFRCEDIVAQQLDELCRLSGIKRGDFLISTIIAEYDRLQGNPQMKKMLEQMRQITDTMKQLTGQTNVGDFASIGDGADNENLSKDGKK